ncbi:MAG: histidinol dehydrogenase, partial [Christensenella sp.]
MLPILASSEIESIKKRLLMRANTDFTAQQRVVDKVLKDVREQGDAALFSYISKFDGFDANAENLLVTEEEIKQAFMEIDPKLIEIMREAAANIEAFHNRQKRENWFMESDGKYLGQLYIPVENAGVYV